MVLTLDHPVLFVEPLEIALEVTKQLRLANLNLPRIILVLGCLSSRQVVLSGNARRLQPNHSLLGPNRHNPNRKRCPSRSSRERPNPKQPLPSPNHLPSRRNLRPRDQARCRSQLFARPMPSKSHLIDTLTIVTWSRGSSFSRSCSKDCQSRPRGCINGQHCPRSRTLLCPEGPTMTCRRGGLCDDRWLLRARSTPWRT